MVKHKLQLPGSILPEAEWNQLKEMVDSAENSKTAAFRQQFYAKCKELNATYGVQKNKDKCLLCGNKTNGNENGLCRTCLKAMVDRGVIRMVGRVHGLSSKSIPCKVCGNPVLAKGYCRRCYYTIKRHGFTTDEELKKWLIENKYILDKSLEVDFPLIKK